MRSKERLDYIVSLVNKRGFISVKELSDLCQVNVMTIRRDLRWLEEKNLVRRTHGGVASASARLPVESQEEGLLIDRIDVLIASAPTYKYDQVLPDTNGQRHLPVVAESTALNFAQTTISVDNYQAGLALGHWAGEYAREHFRGEANVLDLTYHLANTQDRSRGFFDGVKEILPNAKLVLSINTQSRFEMAYQLTRDALTIHKNINVIFGMNDTSALGAVRACDDLEIDPQSLIVLPFGLEGDTCRGLLAQGRYFKAGLAMFPEIVGPVCIEAAIAIWDQQSIPLNYSTPFSVLTSETLTNFYPHTKDGWRLNCEKALSDLNLPTPLYMDGRSPLRPLPRRIGFVYTFVEHEWYHSLIEAMQKYAVRLGVELEVVDVEQTLKDEIEWRRREIARSAAAQIRSGETISMDSGPICTYLARELSRMDKPVTIISNSMPVLEILKENAAITLISTGGVLRRGSMSLVGPTAEATLREIRVDKLFLNVNGVSLGFGLSHSNLSEVTIKQSMIRSAREVILLADHSCFGQESFIQVAPVTAVNRLITDDALPASVRLELSKLGIRVEMARA
jgi:DeoR/GlpR family transcriptional regulator of sugar metabolism/ABC-type sugar transport system substrate-binding protein